MNELHELNDIGDVVRRVLDEKSTSARVRSVIASETGFDPALWRTVAELGWTGMHVAEAYGGSGLPFSSLAVVLRELGRHLTPLPFLSSAVLGTSALACSSNEAAKQDFLPALASGGMRAAVAFTGTTGRLHDVGMLFTETSAGYRVDGHASFVLDAHNCDLLVLCARNDRRELAFLLAERAEVADAVHWTPSVDQTRRLCEIRVSDLRVSPERVLCTGAEAEALRRHLIDVAALAIACDSLGGAEMALEMTTSYAKQRVQFGRPIGSFQAIKHKCADMLLLVEGARVAVDHAAENMQLGCPSASDLPAMAKAHAADAYVKVAGDSMQAHGGIGFTWEHDMHMFFKRAALNQQLFGTSAWHRERVARSLLQEAALPT